MDQLIKDGIWGPANKVLDKDYVRRVAAYHQVSVDACYGLMVKGTKTKVLFYRKGESLIILDYSNAKISNLFEKLVKDAFVVIGKGDPTGSAMSYGLLLHYGPKAESAIPTLQRFLKSDDVEQRTSVALTLWKIDRRAEVSIPPLPRASKMRGRYRAPCSCHQIHSADLGR